MPTKIILVHGFASSSLQWGYQVPYLAGLGFAVERVDLLGHGEGTRPGDAHGYTVDGLYADFWAQVEGIAGGERVALVGHSLGGYLALRYALAHPGQVEKLALLSPLLCRGQLSVAPRLAFRFANLSTRLIDAAPEAFIYKVIVRDRINTARLDEAMRRQVALDYKRADPRICSLLGSFADQTAAFRALPTPALVLWGERDNSLAPGVFAKLAREARHMNWQMVANGGHAIHQTHKEEVNAALGRFFGGCNSKT